MADSKRQNNLFSFVSNITIFSDTFRIVFQQASSPACTELEIIVMDWLGEFLARYIFSQPAINLLFCLYFLSNDSESVFKDPFMH